MLRRQNRLHIVDFHRLSTRRQRYQCSLCQIEQSATADLINTVVRLTGRQSARPCDMRPVFRPISSCSRQIPTLPADEAVLSSGQLWRLLSSGRQLSHVWPPTCPVSLQAQTARSSIVH
ncbi:unnamed protein product [Protopolystoma xenopodis]|uniref:Uncharacterized protein n=1 Tax=Protopolystoma xenopodis TaxID=117903 RepID=A0A3S5CQX4_9PLAT|nr:unnamed protein product [Protopolystoma xenopodis]